MAAAAAVGPCFSSAATTCIQPKTITISSAVRVSTIHPFRLLPGIAYSADYLSLTSVTSSKWRFRRTLAAVAQEEMAQTAESDENGAEEEEGGEGGGGEEEAGEVPPEAPVNTKLYFGNLPYSCDSAQLAGIIQEYASPEMVEVLYDKETGISRGFAFVTMSSVADCEAVIQNLDGSQYCGRTLRVNFSDKPKAKEPLYPETEFKLFVGNLAWSVTSEGLNQVFQECGNVVGARVLYDGETGRSRGYGFVCYSSKAEMDAALESLNGAELEGRPMRVSLALGKKS